MSIRYKPEEISEITKKGGKLQFREAQEKVSKFTEERAWNILTPSRRADHIAREVGKLIEYTLYEEGVTTKKPVDFETKYSKQFGDVLFSLIAYANLMGVDLGEALNEAMKQDAVKYPAEQTRKAALQAYKERTKVYEEKLSPK